MISILHQNPSEEALYRLVPYFSHGLYMGFGPKNRCRLLYVSHLKACGLNMVFGKTVWLYGLNKVFGKNVKISVFMTVNFVFIYGF